MENLPPKVHSRKRRHKSRGIQSGCEDKSRKQSLSHLLKVCTEARKTANCDITQNRLTMRMGLLNKGKASHTIIRTDGGGRREGGDDRESRWKKVPLYQEQAVVLLDQPTRTRQKQLNKENRTVLSPIDVGMAGSTLADSSSGSLPSSPGIEDLSVFLTEHIDPKCIEPSGYLQRVKKRLQEQFKAALQKAGEERANLDCPAQAGEERENLDCPAQAGEERENLDCPAQAGEERENLDCPAQTKRGLTEGIRKMQHHDAPLQATENTGKALLWWSSAAKCLEIPPAATAPPSYLTAVKQTDTREPNSSSEFWSAASDDGPRHNNIRIISQPLLDITDPKSLLALNDLMCRAKQSNSAASSVPLRGLAIPSFVGDTPVSGPSSSEWAYDLDHGCLKYISKSTEKNSKIIPVYQTDRECDVLDIAEANLTSTDYMLPLSSDHSNDIQTTMATADDTEQQQNELVGVFPSRKNSQGSLDEPLSSWEMNLPQLLLTTVRSPSPQQKYYRRKVF